MKSISDEELVLHYYNESEDADELARRIERSPELTAHYRDLCAVLDAVSRVEAPEPPTHYGARLWRRLEPRLIDPPRRLPKILDRRWSLLATAAMLLVAFLTGYFWPRPDPVPPARTASQRILIATVANHLQRTELLLLELVNAADGEALDISVERELANELSASNRLYRQAARRQGDLRMADLLEDLQLLLLEIANSAEVLEPDDLSHIRRRLDDGDLLFKIRVAAAGLRRPPVPHNSNA